MSANNKMIFIYTTCRDTQEAQKIGRLIIEKKLASCVNIWPIESMYNWEGKFQNHSEAGMYVKTVETKLQDIEDLLHQNHSYSVPCVAATSVYRINRPYKEWMATCIE